MAASENLEELMTRFWSSEKVGAVRKFSSKEVHCEENYEGTVKRKWDGRYKVFLNKNTEVLVGNGES